MLELLFLGTGASVPSRDKATSCIAVRSGSDIILMDCGEGSQRQLMISPFSFMKIRVILITHLHGDHVFGLPGLLQTMSLSGRKDPVRVYGPKGIVECVDAFMRVTEGDTLYPLEVDEVSAGDEIDVGNVRIKVYATEHNIPSVGYTIRENDRPGKLDKEKALALGIEEGPDMSRLKNGMTVNGVRPEQVLGPAVKGASISYTGDTKKCQSVVEGSKDVTVLVHECTYMASETDLADEHAHSTTVQAAEDALDAGAGFLILTHVSNRYDELEAVVDEAKTVFGNTLAATDMDWFEIRPDDLRRHQ
jgi:ribonuclease Z